MCTQLVARRIPKQHSCFHQVFFDMSCVTTHIEACVQVFWSSTLTIGGEKTLLFMYLQKKKKTGVTLEIAKTRMFVNSF